jgi:histidyl-tRNA synthetase
LKDYALHFDLTVPFARYVLDWESQLTFPFKRYQIQPCRRGERPQKGRYREFFQCDLDVIWRKDTHQSYLYYDAEVIFTFSQTYQEILKSMHIDDTPVMHISNRKILVGFLRSLVSEGEVPAVSVLIDKYQKIGKDNFVSALADLGISSEVIQKILAFVRLNVDTSSWDMLASLADTPLFQEGVTELREVISFIETLKTSFNLACPYIIDFQIVRGQDYYTGTIFEAMLESDFAFGAVGGGGRYGELTGYIDAKRDVYAGVGASIGFSKLLSKIFEGKEEKQNTVSEYLFVHFPETFPESLALAAKFQSE